MNYNWTEILKNKTDKELFYIYSGQSLQDKEVRDFAELELKRRKFDFKDIDKYKAKWKLERLIKEEKDNKVGFGLNIPRSIHLLIMGVVGILFTIIFVLDIFFEFIVSTNRITYFDRIIFIIVGLGMTLFGFVGYKQKKKTDQLRHKEITDLIEKL
jgi:hypothetical protein